ncbi:MAG: hypothetical protein HN700_14035, partial [Verrucomicrobia bacterium]|nr:hypothetical protein [Verrucomicrobiota bacterium]
LDACLDALTGEADDAAVMTVAGHLLPTSLLAKVPPGRGSARDALARLRVLVLRRVIKAGRGITFSADFLTSFLILQIYQALELTLVLESKETGISDVAFAYGEVAA